MNLATFGSKVLDDAIVASKGALKNEMRVVGVSPFTVYGNGINVCETQDYKKKMFALECNGTLGEWIKKVDIDYLVIDFLEATGDLYEVLNNGVLGYISNSAYVKTHEKELSKSLGVDLSQKISPTKWESIEIENQVQKFYNYIRNYISDEKIILIKQRIPYQYVENGIINTDDYHKIDSLNKFIELCENTFIKLSNVKIIDMPINTLRLSAGISGTSITYSESYKKYLYEQIEVVQDNLDEFEKNKYLVQFQRENQDDIDEYILLSQLDEIEKVRDGRKLICLCQHNAILKDRFKEVEFIPYYFEEDFTKIEENILKYKNKKKKVCFVVPHLFCDHNLLHLLWVYGYMISKDVILYDHDPIVLNNFEGNYTDCFNNVIKSGVKSRISLLGSGGKIDIGTANGAYKVDISLGNESEILIGNNGMADRLKLGAINGSSISIGDGVSFAEKCYFVCGLFNNIRIGQDCMFSTEVVGHCGDAHAIYDMGLDETLNNVYSSNNNTDIVLEDHVWVGYQVMLLKGAYIHSGSIVGARTVLAKEVTNNCIVAGNPVKLVRKDIYWAREPFTDYIENVEFAHYTEG